MTILLFAQKPNNLYHFKILKNDLSDILNFFYSFLAVLFHAKTLEYEWSKQNWICWLSDSFPVQGSYIQEITTN